MYLKLPSTYTDPLTSAPLPQAILVILDAQFSLHGAAPVLIARIYANVTAYQNALTPMWEGPLPLSPTESAAQQPALLQACYAVLANRPEYAGSVISLP